MAIDYITIPIGILNLSISDKQKMLLGLIYGFADKGLLMSNSELGKLLGIYDCQISRALNRLEKLGYITIKGRQSKFRKIYFVQNSKVKDNLLCPKEQTTLPFDATHFAQNRKHNIKNLKEDNNTNKTSFSSFRKYKSYAQEQDEIREHNQRLIQECIERLKNEEQ